MVRVRRPSWLAVVVAVVVAAWSFSGTTARALAFPKESGSCTTSTCTLDVMGQSHGLAGATVQLQFTFFYSSSGVATSCPTVPIDFMWMDTSQVIGTASFGPPDGQMCVAAGSADTPPDAAAGSGQIGAHYSGYPGVLATTTYYIDTISESVTPDTGLAGAPLQLTYSYDSDSCPGTDVQFYLGAAGGSLIAEGPASGCGLSTGAQAPGLAPGTYQVWAMLADGTGPIQGTQTSRDFTITGDTAGTGSGTTPAAGAGTAATGTSSGGGVRTGGGGTGGTIQVGVGGASTGNGSLFNGAPTQASPGGGAGSAATGAPTDLSSLDLSGSVALGRVDPVSNLVNGGAGTLWPVLMTIDLLALGGIAFIARRWRRDLER